MQRTRNLWAQLLTGVGFRATPWPDQNSAWPDQNPRRARGIRSGVRRGGGRVASFDQALRGTAPGRKTSPEMELFEMELFGPKVGPQDPIFSPARFARRFSFVFPLYSLPRNYPNL